MHGPTLYGYVWRTSKNGQLVVCLLVGIIAPLQAVPLELQRRIVDQAIGARDVWLLLLLAVMYLGFVLVQGVLKYLLNVTKGRVLEEVCRDLRRRIVHQQGLPPHTAGGAGAARLDKGTVASILAAEAEDIGGFASESLSVPLLQGGTMVWVLGYLLWIEPRIAALAALIYAPQLVLVPRVQATINRLARRKTALVRKLSRAATADEIDGQAGNRSNRKRANLYIDQVFRTRLLIYRSKFFLTLLGNFLDALGPIIVLSAGGYLVITDRTEVSTLVVFISGFQRLAGPWDQLVKFYRSVSQARVAYSLVAASLEAERRDPDDLGTPAPSVSGRAADPAAATACTGLRPATQASLPPAREPGTI